MSIFLQTPYLYKKKKQAVKMANVQIVCNLLVSKYRCLAFFLLDSMIKRYIANTHSHPLSVPKM